MKNKILILGLIAGEALNTNALAQTTPSYTNCYGHPSCQCAISYYHSSCTYYTMDNETKTLTIYGPREKDENGNYIASASIKNYAFSTADVKSSKVIIPEGTNVVITGNITSVDSYAFAGASGIKSVRFEETSSLRSIGDAAFHNTSNMESINIPNTVTSIGVSSFYGSGLTEVIIPASVESIAYEGFDMARNLKAALVEGQTGLGGYAFYRNASGFKLYCSDQNTTCGQSAIYFTKEDGLYKTIADGKYFASSELMMADNNGNKACKNKDECIKILEAVQAKKSFLKDGKFYASLSDWANGNYEKKRIYTVQEAVQVSAPTGNRVSIRYK